MLVKSKNIKIRSQNQSICEYCCKKNAEKTSKSRSLKESCLLSHFQAPAGEFVNSEFENKLNRKNRSQNFKESCFHSHFQARRLARLAAWEFIKFLTLSL